MSRSEVSVEFFGTLRLRTQVPHTVVPLPPENVTLGRVFQTLARNYPGLAGFCIDPQGRLQSGFIVNLDGHEFTRDPSLELRHGQTLMLLTADVGG